MLTDTEVRNKNETTVVLNPVHTLCRNVLALAGDRARTAVRRMAANSPRKKDRGTPLAEHRPKRILEHVDEVATELGTEVEEHHKAEKVIKARNPKDLPTQSFVRIQRGLCMY